MDKYAKSVYARRKAATTQRRAPSTRRGHGAQESRANQEDVLRSPARALQFQTARKNNRERLGPRNGTVRQTFYNNFRDINDLISYIPINYLKTTQADVLTTENACRAYEYALEHRAFFGQLPTHSGQNNFRETFIAWLEQAYYDALIPQDMSENEKLTRKLRIDFFSIAITNQFLDWCSSGFAWPIDVLAKAQEAALPDFARDALASPKSEAAEPA